MYGQPRTITPKRGKEFSIYSNTSIKQSLIRRYYYDYQATNLLELF